MQFIVKAYDGPDMPKKRMEVRPRHLEGMDKLKEHIICAGGLMEDEGVLKGAVFGMEWEDGAARDCYRASEQDV